MNWSNLPSEILTLIFRDLYFPYEDDEDDEELGISVSDMSDFDRGRTIGQCALVCRGWKPTAERIHFSKLWLNDQNNISIMAYRLSPSTRGLVKKIEYNVYGEKDHRNNLIQFAKLFPYLEVLQFQRNSPLFSTIYNLLASGFFSNLNVIPGPMNQYHSDLYVSCILIMKNRVSEMLLEPENSCYKPFLNENSTFDMDLYPKLKLLYIRSNTHARNNIANFIESTIPNSKIESLRLDLCRSSSHQISNETPLIDISKATINPSYSLKRLFFKSFDQKYNCDDNSLSFIMKKYPNLDALHYKSTIKVFESKNYYTTSFDCSVQFLLYIFNMSHYCVTNFITNDTTGKILSKTFESLEKTTKSRFKNILELSRTRKSNESVKNGNKVYLEIKNGTNKHYLERKVHAYFNLTDDEENQPYYDVFEKAGKYLHEVSIIREDEQCLKSILSNNILKHCVRLERLNLDNTISAAILFRSPKGNNTHSHIIHPNLKQLSLKYDGEQCKEVFPRISVGFPRLEVLELAYYLNTLSSSYEDYYCTMIMPELSLKNLEIKERWSRIACNSIYFKLNTTESNTVTFFYLAPLLPVYDENGRTTNIDKDNKGYTLSRITSEQYEKSKCDISCLTLLIQCKELKEVVIKFIDFSSSRTKYVKCLTELSCQ